MPASASVVVERHLDHADSGVDELRRDPVEIGDATQDRDDALCANALDGIHVSSLCRRRAGVVNDSAQRPRTALR